MNQNLKREQNLKTCDGRIADYNPVKIEPVLAIAMLLSFWPRWEAMLELFQHTQIERCGDLVKKGFKEQSFITLNHAFVRHRHIHNEKCIVPDWQCQPFPFLMQRWTCTRSDLLPDAFPNLHQFCANESMFINAAWLHQQKHSSLWRQRRMFCMWLFRSVRSLGMF